MSSDHSSRPNSLPILGSDVTLTCTLELNSAIAASEILLLMVDAQLSRDGTPLTLTGPTIRDTTFTYTRWFETFGRSDSGNYTCAATVRPDLALTYVTGNETLLATVNIKAGITINCVKIRGFVTLNFFMLLMIDLNLFIWIFQLLHPLWMSKPLSLVPLLQWRSAGVLHLMELTSSLDTGYSMAAGTIFL